ncbi:transcriptional regulator with AbiEi antitoxin N-terminal domain [Bradyrhizobium brasilense]|uniref:Transcriptional regulator with AbiEi antitoxin N-terminal domain n=1 Tax=Bradyrhizobium brasilense TaxID=1419277 RepID=A0A1G6XSE6_9BRAD|nr:type IV toxin-antitoxin system AbiEi family antitoxin domain-containing protein [Bradyrhizobium brasilense]SDD80317.1 transcriptional regulator with AbiEi antitoxin N-terminal domain [Bradyrhizobium brasilense]
MSREKRNLLNQLTSKLPEGMLVDAAWLTAQGYSPQLQHLYVKSGWLEQPTRSVFRRPRGNLSWQQVVISLQTILNYSPLVVGGRTALELQGYAHYLAQSPATAVHLYGPKAPPTWVSKLPLKVHFVYHNDQRLFKNEPLTKGLGSLRWNVEKGEARDETSFRGGKVTELAWGQWDWPLTLSTPERAVFELLDELPNHETFEQVDALFGGLSNLRPTRLQKLLKDCASVKVKRLFLFFADRHRHPWLKRLKKEEVDLGSGKRLLVKGGVLDPTYHITVPGDLDAVR